MDVPSISIPLASPCVIFYIINIEANEDNILWECLRYIDVDCYDV